MAPFPAAQAKFWRGAAPRRRNRGLHTDPGERNRVGHAKKATPEKLLFGALVGGPRVVTVRSERNGPVLLRSVAASGSSVLPHGAQDDRRQPAKAIPRAVGR